MSTPESPIEQYLDELVRALAGRPPRELRAMLAEAEAHLHDDADAAIGRGAPREEAERDAVARFGPAADLAAGERALDRGRFVVLLRQLAASTVLLSGVGAVAVGVSGVFAAVVRAVGGSRALVDVRPGQVLNPTDCTRWLALDPTAGTCRAAAVADWADETVYYRLALGLVGLLVLAIGYWLRRGRSTSRLAVTVRDTVGLAAFGLAAAATLLLGIDTVVRGGGAGQWFTGAAVAAPAAAGFAVLLLRDLRRLASSVT
jgi:hypothetical protein